LIFLVNESVSEHSAALVSPKSDNQILAVEFVDGRQKNTLEHSRHVSQVENVVELKGSSWQSLTDRVDELDSGLGHFQSASSHIFIEFLEMASQNLRVNLFLGVLVGLGDIEARVEGHDSWVDSVVSIWWGHTSDVLAVDNVSELKVSSSLIELVSADQELKQSIWLLGSINVNDWHVKIIDEHNELLSSCLWSVLFEGSLVNVFFNDLLEVQ
jgi:hypothetical protein